MEYTIMSKEDVLFYSKIYYMLEKSKIFKYVFSDKFYMLKYYDYLYNLDNFNDDKDFYIFYKRLPYNFSEYLDINGSHFIDAFPPEKIKIESYYLNMKNFRYGGYSSQELEHYKTKIRDFLSYDQYFMERQSDELRERLENKFDEVSSPKEKIKKRERL